MTEAIVPFLIAICIFLVLTAAIYRYSRNSILPAVTLMMILGAISGIIPITISDSDRLFYFFTTEFSDVILLVFIPLLIFESGRKLKLAELKKEAVPIVFFTIIGMVVTIFLIGIPFGLYLWCAVIRRTFVRRNFSGYRSGRSRSYFHTIPNTTPFKCDYRGRIALQ